MMCFPEVGPAVVLSPLPANLQEPSTSCSPVDSCSPHPLATPWPDPPPALCRGELVTTSVVQPTEDGAVHRDLSPAMSVVVEQLVELGAL